jgi:hypothetical protein
MSIKIVPSKASTARIEPCGPAKPMLPPPGSILMTALAIVTVLSSLPSGAAQSERARAKSNDSGLGVYKIIADRNIFNPKRYARSANARTTRENPRSARAESLVLTGTMNYEKGRFAFFEGSSSSYKKVVEKAGRVADLDVVRIEPDGVLLNSGTNELRLKVGNQLRRQDGEPWKPAGRAELASSSRSFAPPPPPPPQREPEPSQPEESGAAELISRVLENALDGGGPPMPPPLPGQGFPPPPGSGTQPQTQTATPVPESTSAAQQDGTAAPSAPAQSTDEVLRRLMERREQEMNQ